MLLSANTVAFVCTAGPSVHWALLQHLGMRGPRLSQYEYVPEGTLDVARRGLRVQSCAASSMDPNRRRDLLISRLVRKPDPGSVVAELVLIP